MTYSQISDATIYDVKKCCELIKKINSLNYYNSYKIDYATDLVLIYLPQSNLNSWQYACEEYSIAKNKYNQFIAIKKSETLFIENKLDDTLIYNRINIEAEIIIKNIKEGCIALPLKSWKNSMSKIENYLSYSEINTKALVQLISLMIENNFNSIHNNMGGDCGICGIIIKHKRNGIIYLDENRRCKHSCNHDHIKIKALKNKRMNDNLIYYKNYEDYVKSHPIVKYGN